MYNKIKNNKKFGLSYMLTLKYSIYIYLSQKGISPYSVLEFILTCTLLEGYTTINMEIAIQKQFQ